MLKVIAGSLGNCVHVAGVVRFLALAERRFVFAGPDQVGGAGGRDDTQRLWRDPHDTLAVVMACLAAYNARAMGVKHYIAQYMFNSPPTTYGSMDLAKMLAKKEMIEGLHGDDFASMRQAWAGGQTPVTRSSATPEPASTQSSPQSGRSRHRWQPRSAAPATHP